VTILFSTLCIRTAVHDVLHLWLLQRFNGTGGESIYGEKFADENFKLKVCVGAVVRPFLPFFQTPSP
jgi:hypothetical protein